MTPTIAYPAELWDLYDADRNCTGESHIRGQQIPDGRYHIAVHVWLYNPQGQFLISQRAATRPAFPLYWETCGGSVTKGEDSLTGAVREAIEEVGVTLDPAKGKLLQSCRREHYKDFLDIWLFPCEDGPHLELAETPDEVADCRWMTPAEIAVLCDAGRFVHSKQEFFELVLPTISGNPPDATISCGSSYSCW